MATTRVLLEVADVARALDVTPASVRNFVRRGQLVPVVLTPRGMRLFAPDDVQSLAAHRRARGIDRRCPVEVHP